MLSFECIKSPKQFLSVDLNLVVTIVRSVLAMLSLKTRFPVSSWTGGSRLDFYPISFFFFLLNSSLLSLWTKFAIIRFFTFFVSLWAVDIWSSLILTPIINPSSRSSCLELSSGRMAIPVILIQSLLRYCCCLRLMPQSQALLLAVCWAKIHSSTSYKIRVPLDNFC